MIFWLGVLLWAPLSFCEIFDSAGWDAIFEKAQDAESQKLMVSGLPIYYLAQSRDSVMRESWSNYQQMPSSLSSLGDRYESYGFGPLLALAQYIYIDKKMGEAHIRALLLAGSLTQVLKLGFQRHRPGSDNQRSFPSGHTSSAFASATLLSYQYGWKLGIWAYPLAGFVGLSRVADDRHWFSDVVAGAYLGAWVGRACVAEDSDGSSSPPQRSKLETMPHQQLIPIIGPKNWGLLAQFYF